MKNTFKHILTAVAAIALSIPAFAQDQDWSAIKTNKTATYDAANDKVDITLETFVNGYKSNIWTPKIDEKQVPLDIVLVLDVSGSMDEDFSSYSVFNGAKSRWRTYYYLYNNNYVEVRYTWSNGLFDFGELTWRYRASQGNWKKLPDNAVLYTRKKIDALKNACELFVDNVAAESSADCTHNIAIVSYASESSIVKQLTPSHTSADELYEAIANLTAEGATRVDEGMKNAKTIIDGISRDSKKVVIMFTDGLPTESSSFSETVANSAVSTAKDLKDKGVKIYTVGVFDSISDNLHQYMSAVSSDKPEATKYTDGNKGTGKYYMTAKNAEELENIFETIAGEEAHNTGTGSNKGAGVNLGGEDTSVTLKDIVTTNFVIPQTNGVPTDISLKLIPAVSVSVNEDIAHRNDSTHAPAYNSYIIGWETDPTKWETITPSEGQVTVDGNTLNVDGKVFDFSANWIGVEEKWTKQSPKDIIDPSATKQILGKKLVISFSVKPDPTQNGGKVYTNTDESGVYVGDENVTPQNRADYEVPKPVFVPANITIRKSGMLPGESAIFEVTATGTGCSKTYTVAMTANEAGEMKDAVIMRVPIVTNPNAEAAGEALDYITYTVKETTWSWAYDSAAQACQETANETVTANSITRVMTNSEKTHLFEFKNTPKSETPKHGESNANNIFAK